MSKKENNKNWISVPIDTLRDMGKGITFDLYVKLSDEKYAHLFSKEFGIDYPRLAQYIHKGVKFLYLQEDDFEKYQKFIKTSIKEKIVDPKVSNKEKLSLILNLTEQSISEIFQKLELDQDTYRASCELMSGYMSLMAHKPETLDLLIQVISHGKYLYAHSVTTSILAMQMAKLHGKFTEKQVELIGFAGLLHDLACSKMDPKTLEQAHEIAQGESKDLEDHAKLGYEMIQAFPHLPEEVSLMVYQHHETMNGKGYPNQLSGDAIFLPSMMIHWVDMYSALIQDKSFGKSYTPSEAMEIMEARKSEVPSTVHSLLKELLSHQMKKNAA